MRRPLLYLSWLMMSACGPSAEEIATKQAKATTDARLAEFQSDPVAFLMKNYRAGKALQSWQRLMATDCDLETMFIWTPYEAHILQQMPYVIRGEKLEDPSLHTFFVHDGEWYQPKAKVENLQPTREELHCAKKLKNLEERLYASMPEVPEDAKSRFLMDPEAFQTWIQWGSGRVHNPYPTSTVEPLPDGGWLWKAEGVACRDLRSGSELSCSTYTLNCPGITPGLSVLDLPCEGSIDEVVQDLPQENDTPSTQGS